jgi:hypothetical protein
MRCRPGTVPVRGGPGSATHRFAPLALHRIRDTRYRPLHSSFHSHDSNSPSRSRGAFLRERAFAAARAGWSDPCIFLFFCRFGSSIPGLTISNNTHSLLPAAHFAPGVLHRCFTHPESRGGRSAEKRSGAAAPVGHAITRHARRLARRLAPHDAGRSPLGAPPWRFWAPGAALSSPAFASDRAQRAPRTQVVVPGGRGPCLPRRAVTSRRRRTPHLAPPSGSSPETPLDEQGCESLA